jgi:DHA1 family tetracycline resistance protein-like MFS transporter
MEALPTLFFICVIDVLGFGIMVPLLPYMAERFGAGPALITPILGVYSACQLLASPVLGRLSDRYGRRPVLMMSMAVGAASYLLLGLATSLTGLVVARALNGLMAGSIVTVMAYASDVSAPEQRARALGLMGAAVGVGFMLGPAIGGVLAGNDVAGANFMLPALLAAGLALVALGLVATRLPESLGATERAGHAAERRRSHPLQLLRARPGLRWLVSAAVLVTFAQATLESIYAVWAMGRFGAGPRTIGFSLLALAVVAVTMQGAFVRRLVPRFGEYRLALAGIGSYALGLVVVGLGRSLGSAIGGLALIGAGAGAFNPCGSALASRQAEAGNRGAVMGLYQAGASLARVLGPLSAGLLYARMGPGAPYAVAALVVLQAAWCILAARDHPGNVA